MAHSIFLIDGPLELDPSSTVLHYAQTIFEGLKAYRNSAGLVTLFRPDMNLERMNSSATRLALPVCQNILPNPL
jgi:branched-chain amino acid aminotransferase